MPHKGDPGMVGRPDVASPLISSFSPRYRKGEKTMWKQWFHFPLALDPSQPNQLCESHQKLNIFLTKETLSENMICCTQASKHY